MAYEFYAVTIIIIQIEEGSKLFWIPSFFEPIRTRVDLDICASNKTIYT